MTQDQNSQFERMGPRSRARARKTIDPKWWAARKAELPPRFFSLSSGPHLFLDWRYVQAGLPAWVSREGKPFGLRETSTGGPIEAIASRHPASYAGPQDIPEGIQLVAMPAQKSEPFEGPFPGGTVLYEGGRYFTWSENQSAGSDDAFSWSNPKTCSFDWTACPWKGEDRIGASVFVDPSAPPEERFKTLIFSKVGNLPGGDDYRKQVVEEFLQTRPDEIDPKALAPWYFEAISGAVSPDGIHWNVLPGQLLLQVSDTLNVVYYDARLSRYVWYGRCWWHFGRRCIFRAESQDFRRWKAPEMLLWPSLDMHPSDDWYTNSMTLYPGSDDDYLMFPILYRRNLDTTEMHLFSSPDGIVWSRIPGGPVLSPGEPGSWDGGCIFGGAGLVPLPQNRVGLTYTGYPYPHKYPRNDTTFRPRTAYVWWPRGRLCAIEAVESGRFATYPVSFHGEKLILNCKTRQAGRILVEVTDAQGKPLPGRTIEDCDPIVGDFFDREVAWRGQSLLGHSPGQPRIFRFQLRAARLFAFEFRP